MKAGKPVLPKTDENNILSSIHPSIYYEYIHYTYTIETEMNDAKFASIRVSVLFRFLNPGDDRALLRVCIIINVVSMRMEAFIIISGNSNNKPLKPPRSFRRISRAVAKGNHLPEPPPNLADNKRRPQTLPGGQASPRASEEALSAASGSWYLCF